jgi:hypothetical protein
VTATRIEKLSGDVTRLTLSPGERAGVRASVNSYSTENSEEPRRSMLDVECSFGKILAASDGLDE